MQFEMGPPMSTYLLAVTVGRLEGVTQQSSSGMNITAWAVPGLQGQLGVALQVRVCSSAAKSALRVELCPGRQKRYSREQWQGLTVLALQVK